LKTCRRRERNKISLFRGRSHEIAGDIKWGDSPNAEREYRDSLSALAAADAPILDQVRVERKLARTKMHQGRLQEAEADLRQAEVQLSQTPSVMEQAFIDDHQADLLLMRGDTQGAETKLLVSIDLFKDFLKSNPRDVKAIIGLASELQKYGDLKRHRGKTDAFELYQAAIELFGEASQINPMSFAALAGVDLARHSIRLLNKTSDADESDDRKAAGLSSAIDKAYGAGIGRFHFGMMIEEVNQLLQPPFNPESLNNLPKATEYHSAEVRYFWRYIRELPDFSTFVNNERCLDPSYAVFLFHDRALFRIVVRLESGRNDCVPLQRAVDDLAARYGLRVSGSESERRLRYQTRNVAITATTKPRDVSLDFIAR
jgi:tetratricopeptide (TPR) repeat protein